MKEKDKVIKNERDEKLEKSEDDKEREEDAESDKIEEIEESEEERESEEEHECENKDLLCRLHDGQCLIVMHWICWVMNWWQCVVIGLCLN